MVDFPGFEQRAVPDEDQAGSEVLGRDALAQLRADAGGLTRGERDDRALYRSSRRSST
jgi:hypothetical protein